MKANFLKTIIIGVSLGLFILSLTQDAFITFHNGNKESHPGLLCFLAGMLAILGGGLYEWIIWWANPLCIISIYYLLCDNRKAIIAGITAFCLAGLFVSWDEALGSESGSMAAIISFESGYFLWLASIVVLNAGTIYYFFKFPPNTEIIFD